MALNPKYVTAPSLQSYFVDKDTGFPLAGGKVYFYSDIDRTTFKDVYELQGNQANYTYVPLPNPVTLSAVGTMQDNDGNDIIPYYYPFNVDIPTEQELYYIVVTNSNGVPQFTRSAWPNPSESRSSVTSAEEINLVPNGQMLAHTDLPDNELVPGDNPIAQGGIFVVLDDGATSTNTLTFNALQYNETIPQSPRFEAEFVCSVANPAEDFKKISVRWRDVSKFSTGSSPQDNTYTFGIYAQSNIVLPIVVQIYQFYGSGSASPATITTVNTDTFGPQGAYYNYAVTFPAPVGTIDTDSNDDYVAVEIILPTDLTFTLDFTDFALIPGDIDISGPPVQTDADMLTRGVAGWMPIPDANGGDLFCPLVLTREGMEFDHSEIGMIYGSPVPVVSPNSPDSVSNLMPCDGATYISSDYSALGIPYSRLSDYLTSASDMNYPLYGTGDNFVTAWNGPLISSAPSFYVVVNSAGTPIALAADGNTGWTFSRVITYASSTVGRVAIYPLTQWNDAAFFQAISADALTTSATDGTPATGFSNLNVFNVFTGLYAGTSYTGLSATTVSASSLAVGSGQCRYFNFNYNSVNFKMQYRIGGVGTVTTAAADITIDMPSTASPQTVAQLTAYALNALQVTNITNISTPTQGQYWTFQANPAAVQNYYVWYTFDGTGDPNVANSIGIMVQLDLTDDPTEITFKTYSAINKYQFASPALQGMFLRGYDPDLIWDPDTATRFSQGKGIGGDLASYEYSQFESHLHQNSPTTYATTDRGPNLISANISGVQSTASWNTNVSGGNETRPVNSYVNWVIKY